MDNTTKLQLPYILASQAQKHVTHNEALRALDAIVHLAVLDRGLTDPPAEPSDGDAYLVATPGGGDWLGREGDVAAYQDGAWMFYAPQQGWVAWVVDEAAVIVFDGTAWQSGFGGSNPTDLVGVNTTADLTNRLAVKSDAVLFSHDDVTPGTGDMRQVLNKAASGNTVSQLYQNNFSGRAETGLTGDDDFHFKVSPDGSTWYEAIVIDKDNGRVAFPTTLFVANNLLINGTFQINQRGFAGGAITAGDYFFDRWKAATGGANASLSGYVLTLASGEIEQVIELAQWDLSTLASVPCVVEVEAPSADLTVQLGSSTATLTAGAGRQSVTVTPAGGDTGNLSLTIKAASAGSVTFEKVALYVGAVAPTYVPRPKAEEDLLCRAYFERISSEGGGSAFVSVIGGRTTTVATGVVSYVPKRVKPTLSVSATTDFDVVGIGGETIGSFIFTSRSRSLSEVSVVLSSGTLTSAGCYQLSVNSSGFIDVGAEL